MTLRIFVYILVGFIVVIGIIFACKNKALASFIISLVFGFAVFTATWLIPEENLDRPFFPTPPSDSDTVVITSYHTPSPATQIDLPQVDNTETPTQNGPITISDAKTLGTIISSQHEVVYSYIAPVSGRYRFNFDIDDMNKEYFVSVRRNDGNYIDSVWVKERSYIIGDLEKDRRYLITIQPPETASVGYSIEIQTPNEPKIIDTGLLDRIAYTGQINQYYYTPLTSGTYCFTNSSNDSDAFYAVSIHDASGSSVGSMPRDSSMYVTLDANRRYTLEVYSGDDWSNIGFEYLIEITIAE